MKKTIFLLLFIMIFSVPANAATVICTLYATSKLEIKNNTFEKVLISEIESLYAAADIPVGNYTLKVEHTDFETVNLDITITDDSQVLNLNDSIFQTPKPGTIAGTVTSDGKRLAGIEVALEDLTLSTKTDAAGKFLFREIPHSYFTGSYLLRFLGDQYLEANKKVDVDINRLTNILVDLKAKPEEPGSISGYTLPGSLVKSNDLETRTTDTGYFYLQTEAGNVSLEISREGYTSYRENLTVKNGEHIRKDYVDLELKKTKITPFTEDAWIGAFFFESGQNVHYPILNILHENRKGTTHEDALKTILSGYIFATNLTTIRQIITSQNLDYGQVESIIKNLMAENPEQTLKELYLLHAINIEIQTGLNRLPFSFAYRFYHITVQGQPSEDPTANMYDNYAAAYTKPFPELKNELPESRLATLTINNMIPLTYNQLKAYEGSPFLTFARSEEGSLKINPQLIQINRSDIDDISNFFSIFNQNLLKEMAYMYTDKEWSENHWTQLIDHWLPWREYHEN